MALKNNPHTTAMLLGEAALGATMAGWEYEPRIAVGLALASQPAELAPEILLAAVAAEIQVRCERLPLDHPARDALVDLAFAVDGLARELDLHHAARASLRGRLEEV